MYIKVDIEDEINSMIDDINMIKLSTYLVEKKDEHD